MGRGSGAGLAVAAPATSSAEGSPERSSGPRVQAATASPAPLPDRRRAGLLRIQHPTPTNERRRSHGPVSRSSCLKTERTFLERLIRGCRRSCRHEKGATRAPFSCREARPQTTASSFSFFGLMNCSRDTPSHITSGLATSTDE